MSTRLTRALAAVAACVMVAGLVAACTTSDDHGSGDSKATSTSTAAAPEGVDPQPSDPGYKPELVASGCADPTTDTRTIGCFTLTLPENRENPTGRQVELPVIRVRSSADPSLGSADHSMGTATPDATTGRASSTAAPVVYLHGGPGDGAVDGWLAWQQLIDGVPGELVAFDQRGGGHANPRLDCPEHTDALAKTLADHPAWADAHSAIGESIRACNKRLRSQGVDLSQYNLGALVEDLEDLRKSLGVEKISLLAASYGTRLALAYEESYPQRVASLILGGVVTADSGGPDRERTMLDAALSRLTNACSADPGCSPRYPSLGDKIVSAAESLDSSPVTLDGAPPVDSTPPADVAPPVKVTGDEFYAGVFAALYDTSTIPLVPMAVSRIAAGDRAVWDMIGSQLTPALSGGSAFGSQISISCSDLAARTSFDKAYRRAAESDPGRSRDLVLSGTDSFCHFWDATPISRTRDGKSQVPGTAAGSRATHPDRTAKGGSGGRSRVSPSLTLAPPPVLVVAGELDPITPAADAPSTAKRFGGRYLEVRRGGHDAMLTEACARAHVRAFMTASVNDPGSLAGNNSSVETCPDGAPPPFS